ncbi:hypothetical protein [Gracilimonas mengyeensis]|uniref:Antitoxin component YwqK of the YwqJK toxin-antitoxin module n=1 Tax=Gracilimonas mengyeensis TaxID=1302730 RepID=A0A521EEC3_9BACT|nr:hypothetical protein [Gracilimonas mengyeensis]SMO82273.1 Antitoxin component YwqK of the YwqJK toxin-antitoxin module [Gracilimonas mengyeensis]
MKQSIVLIILALVLPLQAWACTCGGPYEFKTKEDLKRYQFIAFVKVDSIYKSGISKVNEHDLFYQADFTILELFKGGLRNTILVNGGHSDIGTTITSCDIGISTNEKWVVFAYLDRNKNLRTGFCTFSKQYATASGEKDWQYKRGIKELSLLREIYEHEVATETIEDGIKRTYYPNGEIEIEQSFENGLPDGQKTIYYPNGQVMIAESYKQGEREGPSIWYDRRGRIKREYQYANGHPIDTCYYYSEFTGLVQHVRIFDDKGNMLQNTKYDFDGELEYVIKINGSTNEYIKTNYYPSGAIRSIAISNADNYNDIRTTEFFESGAKEKEWKYYPKDTTKVFKFWQWSAEGELSSNYILLEGGTKIDLVDSLENKR